MEGVICLDILRRNAHSPFDRRFFQYFCVLFYLSCFDVTCNVLSCTVFVETLSSMEKIGDGLT